MFSGQFLVALACSGTVDYVPCVIGSEISAEAACISNDSVGGGLIIYIIRKSFENWKW